jgi:hypothetical protein
MFVIKEMSVFLEKSPPLLGREQPNGDGAPVTIKKRPLMAAVLGDLFKIP